MRSNRDQDDEIRFGLLLPTSEPELADFDRPAVRLVELARRAVDAGCSSVWAGESLQGARLEPLAVLGAVGTAIDGVSVGTAAFNPAYRQPVATGQALATLDQLVDGRLILGVGCGFPLPSTVAAMKIAGVSSSIRARVVDDIVDIWRQMWNGDATAFRGRVLAYDDLPPAHTHSPGGPPILLAGGSPSAIARAAHAYDGWLPYPPDPSECSRGLADILALQPESRSSLPFTAALFVTVVLEEDSAVATGTLKEFCRITYGLPLAAVGSIQAIVHGFPEQVARALSAYAEAGVTDFVLRVGALHPDSSLERMSDLTKALHALLET